MHRMLLVTSSHWLLCVELSHLCTVLGLEREKIASKAEWYHLHEVSGLIKYLHTIFGKSLMISPQLCKIYSLISKWMNIWKVQNIWINEGEISLPISTNFSPNILSVIIICFWGWYVIAYTHSSVSCFQFSVTKPMFYHTS